MLLSRIIIFFLILTVISAQVINSGTNDVWGNGDYIFSWFVDEAAGTIRYTVDAKTSGWMGFGISQSGIMNSSDLLVCYIDANGNPVVTDRYAVVHDPTLDTENGGSQDVSNITGQISNGRILITFVRRLNTRDARDNQITKGNLYKVIFAMRDSGNPSTENGLLRPHEKIGRADIIFYRAGNSSQVLYYSSALMLMLLLIF